VKARLGHEYQSEVFLRGHPVLVVHISERGAVTVEDSMTGYRERFKPSMFNEEFRHLADCIACHPNGVLHDNS
jgi:hypothetical protein